MSVRVDVHHYIHHDSLEGRLDALIAQGATMSAQLDALQAEVARNTSVDQSAIILLTRLAEQIAANANDPVAMQKLADDLKASSDALAAAVAANTAAPEDPVGGPT
jgi:hypothetical protein